MSFDQEGNLKPLVEAPSTRRLWGDMFGLGEFFRVLSDPTLITQVHAMMGAVIEAAAANRRIEEKLDRILALRSGEDANHSVSEREHVNDRSGPTPPLLTGNGAYGGGLGHSVAGGFADDGNGGDASHTLPID